MKVVDYAAADTSQQSSLKQGCGHRSAFTIVELLVVIAIIGVLISLLIPALSGSREKANQIKCMANLRGIGQALNTYASNNGGVLPWGFLHPTEPDLSQTIDWTTLLLQELDGNRNVDYSSTINTNNERFRELFRCPSAPQPTVTSALLCDYSCHPRIMPDSGTSDLITGDPNNFLVPYKIAGVWRSSEIALIFDASVKNNDGRWTSSVCAFALDDGRLYRGTYLTDQYGGDSAEPGINAGDPISLMPNPSKDIAATNTDSDDNWGNIRFRHAKNSVANVLLLDGHVEAFVLTKAMTPTLLRKNVGINLSPK